jgi:hypothetical protein
MALQLSADTKIEATFPGVYKTLILQREAVPGEVQDDCSKGYDLRLFYFGWA